MILFSFGEHNRRNTYTAKEVSGWRWVFEIEKWREGVDIGFSSQYCWNGEWKNCSTGYYNISLTKYFHLGSYHGYYDGPHCGFSIGFLHFNWSGAWCKKCMPDTE